MKDHYDFSASVRNAYFKDLQEFVTLQTTIMMKLNQNQLDILQTIEELESNQANQTSDIKLSQKLRMDMSLLSYYLEEMKKQGYLTFHPTHTSPDSTKDLIQLTDKGKVAVNYPDDLILEEQSNMNNINFNAPINAPIGVLQNSDSNTVNITQNNNQNIQEIINSLEILEKEIQVFPEEEKQEALVYLNSLKTEIKEKQDPAKIRTFFKGFLKIAVPLASLIVNGVDFTNNVTDLAGKFDVDIPNISLLSQ